MFPPIPHLLIGPLDVSFRRITFRAHGTILYLTRLHGPFSRARVVVILFLWCRSGHVSREMDDLIHCRHLLGHSFSCVLLCGKKRTTLALQMWSAFPSARRQTDQEQDCVSRTKSMPGGLLIDAARISPWTIIVTLTKMRTTLALQYYRSRSNTSPTNVAQPTI